MDSWYLKPGVVIERRSQEAIVPPLGTIVLLENKASRKRRLVPASRELFRGNHCVGC